MITIILYFILGITALILVLSLAAIVIKLIRKDLVTFWPQLTSLVSLIGVFAAVTGVILVNRDMNLKNRPYLFVRGFESVKFKEANVIASNAVITNSGTVPAYDVKLEVFLVRNGLRGSKEGKTEGASLYPNQVIKNNFSFAYEAEDVILYEITIRYRDSQGNDYIYKMKSQFDTKKVSWDIISSE